MSAFPDVAETFIDVAKSSPPDPDALVITAASFVQGIEVAVANYYHAKPYPDPPSLEPSSKIKPQLDSTVCHDSLLGFSEEQSAFSNDGDRSWFFTTSWHADLGLMRAVRALGAEAVKPLSASASGFVLAMAFHPLTKGLLTHSAVVGGASLRLTPKDGPLVVNMLQTLHTNPADEDKITSTILGLIKSIEDLAVKERKVSGYKFIDYSYKTESMLGSYGGNRVNAARGE